MRLFQAWVDDRFLKGLNPSSRLPSAASFEDMNVDDMNFAISHFLCEVKKANGDDYPGDTLYEMLISMQLYLEQKGKIVKFLNDPDFTQVKNTLDCLMQARAKCGLGIRKKQAQVVTHDEEEIMWAKGVLGSHCPTTLLKTLIYMFGLNFALRAAQDHRNLRWEPNCQIELLTDSNGVKFLRYTEDVSKANRGGLKHRKVKPKVVDAYSNERDSSRCIVAIYEKYVSHVPANRPDHAFYLRPLDRPSGEIWYACQPYGRTKIADTVKSLCVQAGIGGYRTNHSLRATSATRMFQENVDEQRICEITGHRSTAVRDYKRTSDSMKRNVSSIIQGLSGCDVPLVKMKKSCPAALGAPPKDPKCISDKFISHDNVSVASSRSDNQIDHSDSVKLATNSTSHDKSFHSDVPDDADSSKRITINVNLNFPQF